MGDPPSASEFLLRLAWVFLLLVINALFVAAEFSLVSVRRSRIVQLASEGNRDAKRVQQAQEQLDRYLSTTQLCITIASLAIGWLGARQVVDLVSASLQAAGWFGQLQAFLPGDVQPEMLAIPVTFALIVYFQVILGELIPKTLAIVYAEQASLRLIGLSRFAKEVLGPFVLVLGWSSNLLLRLLRVPVPDSAALYNAVTAEELQLLIASSGESGSLEAEERELLANVFEFGETVASEVMIPRTSVDAVSETDTVQAVLEQVAASNHSRYPVMGESLDDIRGIVHIKEIVGALGTGKTQLDSPITPFLRKAHFEHENKRVGELLPEMQEHHRSLVVVVDEFGGTAGLITIRNLVEEIVGRISDDGEDDQEPDFQPLDDATTLIQAQVDLDEVNEYLNLDLPLQDDYQTLGGFVIYQTQKIPKVGEKCTYEGIEMTVMSIDGPRLDRIKVQVPDRPIPDDATADPALSGSNS